MADFLSNDFPPVSEKQWKQKIQFDLGGKDFNQTLLTHTNQGLTINPIYHKDSYQQVNFKSTEQNFKIGQSIFISDVKIANSIAKSATKNGMESILFKAAEPFDIQQVLENIPDKIELQFQLQFLSESFIKDVIHQTEKYTVLLNIDVIGKLSKEGNWFSTIQNDFKVFNSINNIALKKTIPFSINADTYQNAGASIIQQVAYALAHGNEYLNQILNVSNNKTDQSLNINATFAVGSNYFFEIAKLRAFRYLWNLIIEGSNIKSKLHISVSPSTRNKTLYDYNTNMLRTTSECMSAILGGADTICNLAYDNIYHKSNEFGERIARNQLLILKEESYFNNATNFSDGSYYIESLTKEISEKSLTLFKEIEKSGGFLKQLKLGTIQRKINETAVKEQELFDSGELVLLGTNKHPNGSDKMKAELELYPFVKTNPRKTLIQPIIAKRLSEKAEQVRLKNEA